MHRIFEEHKFDVGLPPQTLNGAGTGGFFAMKDALRAVAVLTVGAMAAGNTVTLELLQAKDAASTGAKAITNGEQTATATIAPTEAITQGSAFVEIDNMALDGPEFTYVGARVTTNAAIPVAVTLIRQMRDGVKPTEPYAVV